MDRYFEDFAVGQTFGSGRLRIDKEGSKTFAAEFDPQPCRLDEEAARETIFGGLAESGWHTAAVNMRLLVDSEFKPAGGILSLGLTRSSVPVRGAAPARFWPPTHCGVRRCVAGSGSSWRGSIIPNPAPSWMG